MAQHKLPFVNLSWQGQMHDSMLSFTRMSQTVSLHLLSQTHLAQMNLKPATFWMEQKL
jgi:hypothetical protein